MKNEKCYSINEEDFDIELEEMLDRYIENLDLPDTEIVVGMEITYWEADSVPYTINDFFDAQDLIDRLSEQAWNEYEEADEYLHDTPPEAIKELDEFVNTWATKYSLHPNFSKVINIVEKTAILTAVDINTSCYEYKLGKCEVK